MALLFVDGFDHYDPGNQTDQDLKYNLSNAAHTTVTGRSGSGSALGMIAASDYLRKNLDAATNGVVVGFALYLVDSSITINELFVVMTDNLGTLSSLSFKYGLGNFLTVYRGTTYIGRSTKSLPVKSWCYMEFKVVANNTTGSYEVRLNGEVIASDSGIDTVNLGGENIEAVLLEGSQTDLYIDDLYVLDNTGSDNNDFLGEILVNTLYPDADSSNDWTAVGTGTTNADRVSEADADDDTTYVHSGTTAQEEKYSFDAVNTDIDTVYGLQLVNLARFVDDGGSRSFRAIADSVATEALGATNVLTASYANYFDIVEQDPDAVALWTPTTLNAATFGFEVV